jgi:tRNA threonylcarbamoyl adenosine modification protein (Sua5/YciO/YrdC/YwlC family)
MAKYITSLDNAKDIIQSGDLIAFPTETVYGLGGNALNQNAVKKIFQSKGRPANDPLIVHVHSTQNALDLINLNEKQAEIFRILTSKFWPGPLTIVAPAKDIIPSQVTSNTGWVGVRIPNHSIAQEFLRRVQVPIAASPQHVMDDLGKEPIYILDMCDSVCEYGVESSVVKLELDGSATILRRGAISEFDIQNLIAVKIVENQFTNPHNDQMCGPGMTLKHYAPDGVQIYLVDKYIPPQFLSKYAIIDFGGFLQRYAGDSEFYFDLSPNKNSFNACRQLFGVLRDVEKTNADKLFLPGYLLNNLKNIDLENTLADKFYRAASGNILS